MTSIFLRLTMIMCCGAEVFVANSLWAATLTYSHDSLNRLTNATYSDGSRESYFHDFGGNRLIRVTLAPTVHSDTVAPSVPSSLTTEEISPTELRLTWNRAFDTGGSGMVGYFVYTNGVLYATTTTTNLILSGLSPNTPYSIAIAAHDRAANVSNPSVPVNFFHLQPPSLRDPGLTNGTLGFTLHGAIGSNYVIQASSNLVDWESILTNIILAAGPLPLSDPDATNHPRRFYRAVQTTNEPSEPSELIVNGSFEIPIPEMALNGSVGLTNGDTRLSGWTISGAGGPVYCGTSGAGAADGTNVLSFNAGDKSPGTWIAQTFRTVPGIAYRLTFSISRASGDPGDMVRLKTSVKSETNELLGSDESVPPEQFHWASLRIDFTATSEISSVTFLDTSRDTEGVDLWLDSVSVRRFVP